MIPDSRHPEGGDGLIQVGRVKLAENIGRALSESGCVAEQAALTKVAPLHPGKRHSPAFGRTSDDYTANYLFRIDLARIA